MKRVVMAFVVMMALSGCGVGASDLPMPGTSVAGDTYRISAVFDDALNLSIGAQVKLNGVSIGKVRKVESRDFKARADLELSSAHLISSGAVARLRSSTPLGELYIEIDDAKGGERLKSGDVLMADKTSTAPSIEDSMAATSMLLNGGNLGQLRSIVREANTALDGRQMNARDLLTQLTTTTEAFEQSSGEINRTLAALASLSTRLNKRESTINAVLRDVPPAARALRENTDELSDVLSGVKHLSAVSQRVVDQTSDEVLQILRQAGPILDQLTSIKDEFGPGLSDLVRLAELLDRGVPTDYLNTYQYFDESVRLGIPAEVPVLGGLPTVDTPGLPDLGLPDISLPGLALPGLPQSQTEPPDIGLGGLLSEFGGKNP